MLFSFIPLLAGLGATIWKRNTDSKTSAPESPAAQQLPEAGGDMWDPLTRMRKRKGRKNTILAGDVSPTGLQERTLLG